MCVHKQDEIVKVTWRIWSKINIFQGTAEEICKVLNFLLFNTWTFQWGVPPFPSALLSRHLWKSKNTKIKKFRKKKKKKNSSKCNKTIKVFRKTDKIGIIFFFFKYLTLWTEISQSVIWEVYDSTWFYIPSHISFGSLGPPPTWLTVHVRKCVHFQKVQLCAEI